MNNRFQVRDTEEELKKLDEALKKLGYKDRADWYREMKREAIRKAQK
jgi:metal-responsive CopG/Arc/MetJ family transcriptional regulator